MLNVGAGIEIKIKSFRVMLDDAEQVMPELPASLSFYPLSPDNDEESSQNDPFWHFERRSPTWTTHDQETAVGAV